MINWEHLKEVILILIMSFIMAAIAFYFGGCATVASFPAMDIQTWAADSKFSSIVRSQDRRTIQCKDPLFDEMICMSYNDLKKLYETLLSCKSWG